MSEASIDKSIHRVPGDRASLHMHRVPDLLRGPRNRLPQIRLRWSRGLGDTPSASITHNSASKRVRKRVTRDRHTPQQFDTLPFRISGSTFDGLFIIYFFTIERARIIGNRGGRRKTIDDWFKYYWIQWKRGGESCGFNIFFSNFMNPFFFLRERENTNEYSFTFSIRCMKYFVFFVLFVLFSLWKISLKFRIVVEVNIASGGRAVSVIVIDLRNFEFSSDESKSDGLLLLKGMRSNYRRIRERTNHLKSISNLDQT